MHSVRQVLAALMLASPLCAGILHIHPGNSSDLTYLYGGEDPDSPDQGERQFQHEINRFFVLANQGAAVDTAGWCNWKINCARFDYRHLTDTIKIPLTDSSKNRLFTYPVKNYVTSSFGPRRQFWHFGTDIKVNYRDTIRCAFDGIVRVVLNDRYGYGKVVVVRHHFGLETLYAHLSVTSVKNNQEIRSGDIIGLGGRTGRATGTHLHFEMRFCGEPFDPAFILDMDNYTLRSDTLALSRATFDYISDIRKSVVHTIRPGDNLGRIAGNYGTSVGSLCRLNGITPTTILKVGRRLVVRKVESPEVITESDKIRSRG